MFWSIEESVAAWDLVYEAANKRIIYNTVALAFSLSFHLENAEFISSKDLRVHFPKSMLEMP
jgi:hypothetical protein